MSPWKVLGWLLVALLCLLLTAGAYGLALLWGWSPPSVWWLAAIADSRGRGQPTAYGLVVEELIPHRKGRSLVGRVAFASVAFTFAGQVRRGKINGDPMGVRRAP